MNRSLYYLLLVVIIPCSFDLRSDAADTASSQVTQTSTKAQQKAAPKTAPANEVKAVESEPAQQAQDDEFSADTEQMAEDTSESEAPVQEPAKKQVAMKKQAAKKKGKSKKQMENADQQEAAAMRDELAAMGLEGKELDDMLKVRHMVMDLVKEGKEFFTANSLDVACNAMIKTKQFVRGEVYLFLYDMDGYCLAQGSDTANLWKDFKHEKVGTDEYGISFVNDFISTARAGGGWVSYRYNNAAKVAYVELVQKGNTQYVIGGGFYPYSKVYAVMNLVKFAVAYIKDAFEKGEKNDEIFSTLSFPGGRFITGDLYLYALDEQGKLWAQGDKPSLVRSNVLNYQDANGKFANQEIINRLNKGTDGVWVDYVSKGAPKKAYAEKVTDKDGKNYYIVCGYYPDTNRQTVEEMVHKGYVAMKKSGEQAFKAINSHNKQDELEFHYGDVDLQVYAINVPKSKKGDCVANGSDIEAIGKNFMDEKDEMGKPYIKNIIDMVEQDKSEHVAGQVSQKRKNAYEFTYFEKVDTGSGEYVIISSFYPISKQETMELLVKDAVGLVKSTKQVKFAFNEFVKKSGNFSLGDLEIFVFEKNGICAVFGSDPDYIWRQMIDEKDELGAPYVKNFINQARRIPARIKYRMDGADALAYVEKVDRKGMTFYVGSKMFTYDNIELQDAGGESVES